MSSRRTSSNGLNSASAWLSRRALASTAPLETNELMRYVILGAAVKRRLSDKVRSAYMQAGTSIPTETGPFLNRLCTALSLNCRRWKCKNGDVDEPEDPEPPRRRCACHPPSDAKRTSPRYSRRSRMIELMELAAARLMKQDLGDAESSVAIAMNVTHVASTHRRGHAARRGDLCRRRGTTASLRDRCLRRIRIDRQRRAHARGRGRAQIVGHGARRADKASALSMV